MSKLDSYLETIKDGVKCGVREFFSPVTYLIKLVRKLLK